MGLQEQELQPIEDDSEINAPDSREDALGLVFYDGALFDGSVDSQLFSTEQSVPDVSDSQISNCCRNFGKRPVY